MTQSAFKPKNSHLDVIREHNTHKEEDEEEEGSGAEGKAAENNGGNNKVEGDVNEEGGQAIAKRVKRGVQNRLAQNARISQLETKANSANTTMTTHHSSVLHNTGSSIINS